MKKKTQYELGAAHAEALCKSEIKELEEKVKALLFVKEICKKRLNQKPTPVEWLVEQVKLEKWEDTNIGTKEGIFEQAKQMERERYFFEDKYESDIDEIDSVFNPNV